jgi:hypothetical protein
MKKPGNSRTGYMLRQQGGRKVGFQEVQEDRIGFEGRQNLLND